MKVCSSVNLFSYFSLTTGRVLAGLASVVKGDINFIYLILQVLTTQSSHSGII
jgi:hypothetical protein